MLASSFLRERSVSLLLGLILLFVWLPCAVRAERLPIKTYTTADGLAHNTVNKIMRDSRGFLWFATFEGLSRFDGYSFTTYGVHPGLPSPVVNDLLETRAGQYWIATGAGLALFNPRGIPQRSYSNGTQNSTANAAFTVYYPAEDPASNNILSLLEDSRGTIWCVTARGLYRLEQQDGQVKFQFIELGMSAVYGEDKNVTSMIEDRRGSLWLGSTNSGIYHLLPDGRIEHYSDRDGLPSNFIHSLLEDREGRLWVGTRNGGLVLLVSDPDPRRAVVARVYTQKDGLPTKWINQLFQASDGSLWAGSNSGLIRFTRKADGSDYRFRAYAQPHGLTYQEVQTIAEDRSGNLWLGMLNGGAIKLARSGITAFGEADGFSWSSAIFKDSASDLFVIGGPSGGEWFINLFDGDKFRSVRPQLSENTKRAGYGWGWNQTVLEDSAGEWWYATGHGLYRFPKASNIDRLGSMPPKAVYTTRNGLAGDTILRLFEDSRGDIWIGTVDNKGLSRWERSSGTFHHYTENDGLPSFGSFYPISFCEDRAGNVWIGFSVGGGLVRFRDGHFTRFTSDDRLPEGGIFNLFVDSSGRLWVPTTRGGVCRIDDPSAERPTIFTYTTEQGLSSSDVKCVTEDRWRRIYFGTARDIDRLDPATGRFKHYTTTDGVLLGDVHAAMQDREGTLWFSFSTGLMRLVPEPDSTPLPPPILITSLHIAGQQQPISALGETDVASIELGPDKNQLYIDFVALGFSPGEGLLYQYKLEGTDADWSPPTDQRTVNFANVAPGSYRFLVRAVNADGVLSERPASFSFTVLPPIWQRWWFIAFVATMMGLIAYALYRYRVARLVEMERVRTRIAADLHDDIGSSLSQISVLSEVLRKQLVEPESAVARNLHLINRVSHEALESMSDIVWAINPLQDHLSDLVRRMRRLASEVLPARDIEFTFKSPATGLDLRLGADIRREVFLMFKEILNNMVRHSGCTRADLDLKIEKGWLLLVVADNGKGFEPDQVAEGNGLVSLRRRARSMGGETLVVSRAGAGTTVRIRVPHRHHKRLREGNGQP